MRIPRPAPVPAALLLALALLLLLLLLPPGVQAVAVVSTGPGCLAPTQPASGDASAAPTASASCGGAVVCSPVFVEFELDPPQATPILRPDCVEQTIQDVRELVGV